MEFRYRIKFIIIFSYIQVVLLLFNILLNKINYLDKDTGFFIYKMLTLPAILSLLAFLILAFFKNNKEFIFIYLESVSFLKEGTKTLIKRKLKSFFEKDENSQFNELLGLCIAHGFYLLSKIIMFLFL